jgi:cbb3-type cytochrome oxidase maturation protein
MSALFILLGASLSIAIGFLVAFIWSVKSGQYDDEYTPSVRMLFDDTKPIINNVQSKLTEKNTGKKSN